jgi:outer membrane biosynthesis protein TonB
LYNDVSIFEGVYVGKNIELRNGSRTLLHIHIETLESYIPKDDALFATPTGAAYAPGRVTESGAVIAGNIIKRVAPMYPAFAKQQGIQGVVVLRAVITREGKIANLEPIIGPPALIPPSMDAVKHWEYHPYLLNGVPVEVETQINVVFSLR